MIRVKFSDDLETKDPLVLIQAWVFRLQLSLFIGHEGGNFHGRGRAGNSLDG